MLYLSLFYKYTYDNKSKQFIYQYSDMCILFEVYKYQ